MTHHEAAPETEPSTPAQHTPATPASEQASEATLAELVSRKLSEAAAPLKFADVLKGLPKPKASKQPKGAPKVPPVNLKDEVERILGEEIRAGRAFKYASGPKQLERYWAKDEKQHLREAATRAGEPQPIAALAKSLKTVVPGVDPAFAESVVRELIADGRLFEYPAKTAKAGPRFGSVEPPPPPPVLETGKHKKSVDSLARMVKKLLEASRVDLEALMLALRARLPEHEHRPAPAANVTEEETFTPPVVVDHETERLISGGHAADSHGHAHHPHSTGHGEHHSHHDNGSPDHEMKLSDLIMKELEGASVVSIADLRKKMKPEHQGEVFNEALLHLDDDQKVILYEDANPLRYSEVERAELLSDGASLFTTISKRD